MRPVEALLPVFRERFANLEEIVFSRGPEDTFYRCFGCGPGHPAGLRVRYFRDNGGVVSPVFVGKHYEGPPGVVHGGIIAAHLDEVLGGAVAVHASRPAVTGELTVRFQKPAPTETPLIARARVVGGHGKYVDAEGMLEDFASGAVVAMAKGRFFPV